MSDKLPQMFFFFLHLKICVIQKKSKILIPLFLDSDLANLPWANKCSCAETQMGEVPKEPKILEEKPPLVNNFR